MADIMDIPPESQDHTREKSLEASPPLRPPPPRTRDRDTRDYQPDSRNRSPPLPPPPPMGSSRGERDRDYRRRSCPSPPPYRDRRHSPPRRSPPPGGFKRSRRDDGGYDRRRGSPRGGFGSDDRYGYDYGGGYDRGGPGRGGYGDERSRGRCMNRQSDWLDSGRGYSDVSNAAVTHSHSMLARLQQFAGGGEQLVEDEN